MNDNIIIRYKEIKNRIIFISEKARFEILLSLENYIKDENWSRNILGGMIWLNTK